MSCVGVLIVDRCCLWFVSVTTCWNKLAQSESENTKLKSSVYLSWRKQRYDLITAMKDVRCIQRECSFRRDRTLLYCNISCESTDGLLLLLLDTFSKHLAADWMNHLSISGLLQSVRSAARGERPTSRTNWWIKLSIKRKTLQPAAVPRTLRQTGSLTGLVLAWARKSRNVTINLQDSSLTFSQNFAFCAMFDPCDK